MRKLLSVQGSRVTRSGRGATEPPPPLRGTPGLIVGLAAAACLGLCACSSAPAESATHLAETGDISPSNGPAAPPVDPWAAGPHAPAHTTVSIADPARDRALVVEVWYPGEGSTPLGAPTEAFEPDDDARATLRHLLEAAPSGCPTLTTGATRDGAARADLGALPLVAFSHCRSCGRYASFSLAERLASHGMIVVSADHAGALPFAEEAAG
jgi:predicted dienelactone hydrolase